MCFDKEKRREEGGGERRAMLHHVIVHDFKASIMSCIMAV